MFFFFNGKRQLTKKSKFKARDLLLELFLQTEPQMDDNVRKAEKQKSFISSPKIKANIIHVVISDS